MNTIAQKNQKTLSPRKKKRKYSSDNAVASFSNVKLTANDNGSLYIQSNPNSNSSGKETNITDRVLDLSKYTAETGLYTLTRDWMNANTAMAKRASLSSQQNELTNTDDESESSNFITQLPDPDPAKVAACITIEQLNQEIGKEIRSTQANDIELIRPLNLDEFMGAHALLKLHVNRWKSCRRKWVNYYEQTNRAYKNSNDLFKSIYEEMQ
jgi:hypothetical protein